MTLFKSKSLDIDTLIEDNQNNPRNNAFLRIFKYIFTEYEKVLKEKDAIDFMPDAKFMVQTICGKGGGRADMAQGGGLLPDDLEQRFKKIRLEVETKLAK